jgi:hypothetical protein
MTAAAVPLEANPTTDTEVNAATANTLAAARHGLADLFM